MKVYINSAGRSPAHDYSWKSIDTDKGSQKPTNSPDEIRDDRNLLDARTPSLLLKRNKGEVALLVSDMKGERRDYQGRVIRNSVVWVSKDEALLRKLAIRALRSFIGEGSLPEDIDRLIQSERKERYRGYKIVSPADFLAEKFIDSSMEIGEKEPGQTGKIYKRNDVRILDLIGDLKEHRLPKKDGPLVVVVGNTSQSTLKEAEVWRGLSKLVEKEGAYNPASKSNTKPLFRALKKPVPAALVLVMLLLAILQLFRFEDSQAPEPPKPKSDGVEEPRK